MLGITSLHPEGEFFAPVSCGTGFLQRSQSELRYFAASLDGQPGCRIPIKTVCAIELWIPVNMHCSEPSSLRVQGGEGHPPIVVEPVGILQWPAVLDLMGTVVQTSNGHPLEHLLPNQVSWEWEEGSVEIREEDQQVRIHTFTGKGRQTIPSQTIPHETIRCVGAMMKLGSNPKLVLVADEQPVELYGYGSSLLLNHVNSMVNIGMLR